MSGFRSGRNKTLSFKLLSPTFLFVVLFFQSVFLQGEYTMRPNAENTGQEELLNKLLLETPPRRKALEAYKEKIDSKFFEYIVLKVLQLVSQGGATDAFPLSELEMEVAEFLGNEECLATAYQSRASLFSMTGQDTNALKELKTFIKKFYSVTSAQGPFPASSPKGRIFYDLHCVHWRLGAKARAQSDSRLAKEHFFEATEAWKKLTFNTEVEKILYNQQIKNASLANVSLGNIYFEEEDSNNALKCYEQVLPNLNLLEPHARCSVYLGLGQIYVQLERFQDALESFGHAVELGDESDKATASMFIDKIRKLTGSKKKHNSKSSATIY